MAKFTGDTILEEIFKEKKAKKVLEKYHLPCLVCPFARFEMKNLTIGQVCEMYNIDLKKILKKLNQINEKKKK